MGQRLDQRGENSGEVGVDRLDFIDFARVHLFPPCMVAVWEICLNPSKKRLMLVRRKK